MHELSERDVGSGAVPCTLLNSLYGKWKELRAGAAPPPPPLPIQAIQRETGLASLPPIKEISGSGTYVRDLSAVAEWHVREKLRASVSYSSAGFEEIVDFISCF